MDIHIPQLGGLSLLKYRLVMAFKRRPTSLDIVTVPIGSTAQQADRDYNQQPAINPSRTARSSASPSR
jgi:hypothetical protein